MTAARPAKESEAGGPRPKAFEGPATGPNIVVVDTGLAWKAHVHGVDVHQLPPLLARLGKPLPGDEDPPDRDKNHHLDPVAGHGTFVAGIIERMAPGCRLGVVKQLAGFGDGDVWSISYRLIELAAFGLKVQGSGKSPGYTVPVDGQTIFNLSFSGYAPSEMRVLSHTIRWIRVLVDLFRGGEPVFVASAGNDGTTRPAYPACLDDVVGVAATGPYGPAPFTNGGDWVNACAPGQDVVSTMFLDWDGPIPEKLLWPDPDRFKGWARWSGTSFAAPVVVGALARRMRATGCSAKEAVDAVVGNPWALRLPGLGTVVTEA